MTPTLEALGINRLSVQERLELLGKIWDSITDSEFDQTPMPQWQIELAEKRMSESDADPSMRLTRDELNARLRKK